MQLISQQFWPLQGMLHFEIVLCNLSDHNVTKTLCDKLHKTFHSVTVPLNKIVIPSFIHSFIMYKIAPYINNNYYQMHDDSNSKSVMKFPRPFFITLQSLPARYIYVTGQNYFWVVLFLS